MTVIKGTDIRTMANPGFIPKTPDEDPEQEEIETPNPEEETPEDPEQPEIEEPEAEEEPEEEEPEQKETPEAPLPPEKPEIDYKQKFADSTREAQILTAKVREQEAALELLTKEDVPTDEELAQQNPNWEFLSDFEQETYRDIQTIKRQTAKSRLIQEQGKQEQARQDALNHVYAENKELSSRKLEFEAFIGKDSRKGIPIADLVGSFLWEIRDEIDSAPGRKIQKRPILQDRSAGGKITPKVVDDSERMSLLRKNDLQAYNAEMLRRSRIRPTRRK